MEKIYAIPEVKVMADWIEEIILDKIVNNVYGEGYRLDQKKIAEEFRVSRTPVREAIIRLAAEGFVDFTPHRGAFVKGISKKDISDFFDVRNLLEQKIIYLATNKIPDDVILDMETKNQTIREMLIAGNAQDYLKFDIAFHKVLPEFIDNMYLKKMFFDVAGKIRKIQQFDRRQSIDDFLTSTDEHYKMIQAIKKRNPELAAKEMDIHIENSKSSLLKCLS